MDTTTLTATNTTGHKELSAPLTVRGVNIRKADGTLLPIGKAAEEGKISNPAKMQKEYGANPSDDQKAELVKAKGVWKQFAAEYNRAREEAFKQNDLVAAVINRENQAKSVRQKRNKAGDIIGYTIQYAKTNPQSELDRQKAENAELRRKIEALMAEKTASVEGASK